MTKLSYKYYLENRIAFPYDGNLMIVVKDCKDNGIIDNMPEPDDSLRTLGYSDNADGFAIDYEIKGIDIFNKEEVLFFPPSLNLSTFLRASDEPDFKKKDRLYAFAIDKKSNELKKLIDRYVESNELYLIGKKIYETDNSKSIPKLCDDYLNNNSLLRWDTLRPKMEKLNVFWNYLDWQFNCKEELIKWCKDNNIEFIDDVNNKKISYP